MDRDRKLLIEEYLDGSIREARAKSLVELLKTDSEFSLEFAKALRMKGLLHGAFHPDGSCEELSRVVTVAIGGDRDGSTFESRVMDNLRDRPPVHREKAWTIHLWGRIAFLAACLMLVVGSVVYNTYWSAGRTIARVAEVTPGVAVVRGDARMRAAVGFDLRLGDRIETKRDQNMVFSYAGEETEVRVGGDAGVEIESGKGLRIARGRIDAVVAPQPKDAAMSVITPHAEIRVVSTVFGVAVTEDSTQLEVRKGVVRASRRSDGKSIDVADGHYAVIAETEPMEVSRLDDRIARLFSLPPEIIEPGRMTFDGTNLWVCCRRTWQLYRLDPGDGCVLGKIDLKGKCERLDYAASSGTHIYGMDTPRARLFVLDIATGELAWETPYTEAKRCRGMAFGDGFLWIALHYDRYCILTKTDPEDGATLKTIRFEYPLSFGVAYLDGALWVRQGGILLEVDAGTGKVRSSHKRRKDVDLDIYAGDKNGRLFMLHEQKRRILLVRPPEKGGIQ